MGFNAYETWRNDLRDDEWYEKNDDAQLARRFSVNQFCTLALFDARKAAYIYLNESIPLLPGKTEIMNKIVSLFKLISEKAEQIHEILDSGEYLEGSQARKYWTREMRLEQAELLFQMLTAEQEAMLLVESII